MNCSSKFEGQSDDPVGLKFLTETQLDFGPFGLESLFPEDQISINCATNAKHVSMMKNENTIRLIKLTEVAMRGD